MTDMDAFTISEFCHRHHMSRGFFYTIQAQGKGPRVAILGGKRLITREAAEEWRARLEGRELVTRWPRGKGLHPSPCTPAGRVSEA